jgi:hypothetical protein
MPKSATEVMQDIIYAAVIDGVVALKQASKGLPNTLLRDLNAMHANTTLADLPPDLQGSIQASVRAAFTRLLKEGYSVSPGQPAPARAAPPRRDGPPPHGQRREGGGPPGQRRPPRREPGSPDRPDRPPRPSTPRGGRPPRKPTS